MKHTHFKPAWWCPGPHLQTVWQRLFPPMQVLETHRERWITPDDDFIDLDWLVPPNNHHGLNKPVVLILHGLEGSSQSEYILSLLADLNRCGWQAVAMNFRSCSGEINLQRRLYHAGETTDLAWVVHKLAQRVPECPIYIVGFSLGGNVLLKWLGEEGDKIPDAVRAAVAISVPFDLEVAARHIDQGINRIYATIILKTLRRKVIQKTARYPGLIDPRIIQRIYSLSGFDDIVIAPLHGFRSGLDYWACSSSLHYLSGIHRPTLLISAEDDPIFPGKYLPKKIINDTKWLESNFTSHGGHLGFVQGPMPWAASYWIDQKIVHFLKMHEERP
jgi:predicted alpha/beta-fold hydrolase